ncbi:uncharacterized protein [Anabrus simplex]|uniref:uncharacterized protein isoform X2 n=1 Tax=Anabrus simplex TaxID=316456 RepID=UPI0035A27ECC
MQAFGYTTRTTRPTRLELGKLVEKKELVSSEVVALEDISNDDEVWLVQCPVDVMEEALKGQCFYIGNNQDCNLLSSNGRCKLKVKVSAAAKKTSFSCLVPSREQGCLKSVVLPSAGHIVLSESVSEDQSPEEMSLPAPVVSSKCVHSLPTNLKLRHPLLGLNFPKCQEIQ